MDTNGHSTDPSMEYRFLKGLYDRILKDTGSVFSIGDADEYYYIEHKRLPIQIDLPETLSAESKCRVYLMATKQGWDKIGKIGNRRPEDLISDLKGLIIRRDILVEKGYDGEFAIAEDCPEYRYDIPATKESDLVRILKDFSF